MSQLAQTKLYKNTVQQWTENFSSYPSDEYTCKIVFKQGTSDAVELNGVAQSDKTFLFTTANDTFSASRNHNYQIIAAKDSNNYLVETDIKHIYPDLSSAEDARSEWHIIHDYLLAEYKDMVANGRVATTVSINGKSHTYSHTEIIKQIDYAAKRAGLNSDGIGKSKRANRILVKF